MGSTTEISWADATFNPWLGCTKISPGCQFCYAEAFAKRYNKAAWGPNGTRVKTSEANWRKPVKWNRDASFRNDLAAEIEQNTGARPECYAHRPRVFCASLADVFEDWQGPIHDHRGERLCFYEPKPGWLSQPAYYDEAPGGARFATIADLRRALFALIDATPHLDWLLLTKRPENVRRMSDGWCRYQEGNESPRGAIRFPRNVWLGTSVSDQETADRNIPELLKLRDLAPVLFLSVEPLLGPVDLTRVERYSYGSTQRLVNAMSGEGIEYSSDGGGGCWTGPRIDWVIAGGESGPGARPCNLEWIRSIVAQCKAANVPCFVKQLGSVPVMGEAEWRALPRTPILSHRADRNAPPGTVALFLNDRKGGDPRDWPEDLRVRQFPTEKAIA